MTADSQHRNFQAREIATELRSLAIRSLPRMYRREDRLFVHHLGRGPNGQLKLEGISRRYTAIVLIGLAREPDEVVAEVLAGDSPQDVCGDLLANLGRTDDLGEVALTLWAARATHHPGTAEAEVNLRSRLGGNHPVRTSELAWALSALISDDRYSGARDLSQAIAARLLGLFRKESGLFAIGSTGARPSMVRHFPHVASFADQSYPIHALSLHYQAGGDRESLDAARKCAERIRENQGDAGQWCWHYDVRTGRTVEQYPVYSIHQDAMAPMALFELQDACGDDHTDAIARGLAWLVDHPETGEPLIDRETDVIWRKVARREPGKLTRGLQAAASRTHRKLRAPLVETLFPPGVIDYECRPYHMGWILYAWPVERINRVDVA